MHRKESIVMQLQSAQDILEFLKTAQSHIENDINPPVAVPRRSSVEKENILKSYLKKAEGRDDVVNNSLVSRIIGGNYDTSVAVASKHALNDPLIPPEREWLAEHPDTDTFDDIRRRVLDSKRRQDEINLSSAIAHQYFQHEQDKTTLKGKNLPGINPEKNQVIIKITNEIIDEVVASMIPLLCGDLLSKSKSSLDVLNRSFIKALTNFSDQNKRFLKMSGRIDVMKGALLDTEEQYRHDHYAATTVENNNNASDNYLSHLQSLYNVSLSQSLLDIGTSIASVNGPVEKPPTEKQWKPLIQDTISLTPDDYIHDSVLSHPLLLNEQAHVGQMSLQLITGAPLMLPSNIPGKIAIVKSYQQHKEKKNTLLFVGTIRGRLLMYLLPWDASASKLVAISPKAKDSKEKSEIIDIKASPMGSQMFMAMNKAGYVYVYHMNQAIEVHTALSKTGLKGTKKSNGFLSSLFGGRAKEDLMEMNCIFKINKYDLTLAVPLTKSTPNPYDKSDGDVVFDINGDIADPSNGILDSIGNVLKSHPVVLDKEMYPNTQCFHPSISVAGRCTSIMVGTSGGDIVKFNMDYHTPTMNCKIMYPLNNSHKGVIQGSKNTSLPFVVKEYIHYHDAPLGFVLTGGNKENKGNQVYRELFHYHKAPIVLLDILNGLSDCLISIDEEGFMAVWRYSSDYLQEKHWFQPQTKLKLNLLHKQYVTEGDPVGFTNNSPGTPPELWVPITPSADELLQLKKRHRLYDKNEVIVETYYPIFSPVANAFIQYVCYTVTKKQIPRRPVASPKARPARKTVVSDGHPNDHKEFLTPLPADRPVSPGPTTSVIADNPLMSGTLSPRRIGSPNARRVLSRPNSPVSPTTYWSYHVVKEKHQHLKLVSTVLSHDGTDIVMMLSAETTSEPIASSSRSKKVKRKSSTVYYFVVVHSITLQFHDLYPHIVIDHSVDQLLDYCVGPVMAETLTRLIFVLTKKDGVRLFSLETGEELQSGTGEDGFPFKSSLKSFQPTHISVCPSQRTLTLSSVDDARLAVYVIKHSQDGQAISVTTQKQRDSAVVAPVNKSGSKRDEAYLRSLSQATVLDIHVTPSPLSEIGVDMNALLDELVEKVFQKAEMRAIRKHQSELLASLYGPSPYGFIEPKVWPPPEVELKRVDTEEDLPAIMEGSESKDSLGTAEEIIEVAPEEGSSSAVAAVVPENSTSQELSNSDSTILGICVLALEDAIAGVILNNMTESESTVDLVTDVKDTEVAVVKTEKDDEKVSEKVINQSSSVKADIVPEDAQTLPPPVEAVNDIVTDSAEEVPDIVPTTEFIKNEPLERSSSKGSFGIPDDPMDIVEAKGVSTGQLQSASVSTREDLNEVTEL